MKRRVYFNEFNVLMDRTAYLPLVSGLLRAYAETSAELAAAYEFKPFLFHRAPVDSILAQYDEAPDVAAFSVSMWNEQTNLRVAEQVKRRYPECLVVFGGPQVPHYPDAYFREFPFIDVAVRGEGEEAFAAILDRFRTSREFAGIAGVAWRDPATGACIRNEEGREQPRDLDAYPSPYLEGLFEELIDLRRDIEFQAIIETNRGCPFLCTFCFWGQGGLSRKYRYHGIERVAGEIEWCATHRIRYVFNADSNFGMHKRDADIARLLVETKKKYGYPEKFRTCFGKNTDENIYEIARLLHAHDLEKGITLARQSNDRKVLQNIKRSNIKLSTYENLQVRFNEHDVPVYSELILGLPGETYETWTLGIEEMLKAGLKNQLFIYLCQVYPNTELGDPQYMQKYGVVTRRIRLTEIHAAVRDEGLALEYEDIVVATDTMPVADWRRMAVFSWMTMLLHSMKLGFFAIAYLAEHYGVRCIDFIRYVSEGRMPPGIGVMLRAEVAHFEAQVHRLLDGHGRGHVLPEFGGIYWDEEEAAFLRVSDRLDRFYDEFELVLRAFLDQAGIEHDDAELGEAVRYQRLRIPGCTPPAITEWVFRFNFPEYFETLFRSNPTRLRASPQVLTLLPRDFQGDKVRYAREVIMWGRKSGTLLTNVRWKENVGTPKHVATDGERVDRWVVT